MLTTVIKSIPSKSHNLFFRKQVNLDLSWEYNLVYILIPFPDEHTKYRNIGAFYDAGDSHEVDRQLLNVIDLLLLVGT